MIIFFCKTFFFPFFLFLFLSLQRLVGVSAAQDGAAAHCRTHFSSRLAILPLFCSRVRSRCSSSSSALRGHPGVSGGTEPGPPPPLTHCFSCASRSRTSASRLFTSSTSSSSSSCSLRFCASVFCQSAGRDGHGHGTARPGGAQPDPVRHSPARPGPALPSGTQPAAPPPPRPAQPSAARLAFHSFNDF